MFPGFIPVFNTNIKNKSASNKQYVNIMTTIIVKMRVQPIPETSRTSNTGITQTMGTTKFN
jgi:hypothetical protein